MPKLTRNAASVRGFVSSAHHFAPPAPAAWINNTKRGISTIKLRYVSVNPSVSPNPGRTRRRRHSGKGALRRVAARVTSAPRLIDLVEDAAVAEMGLLRGGPAAQVGNRQKLELGKAIGETRGNLGQSRTQVMFG